MTTSSSLQAKPTSSLNYVTTFNEKILGVRCQVEVAVDIDTGLATVVAGMRQAFRSDLIFRVSLETLEALAIHVKQVHAKHGLLDALLDGADDHQMNCICDGTQLTVVKPSGKPARFTLTIGLFHKEGALAELSTTELDEAIQKLAELQSTVRAKVF